MIAFVTLCVYVHMKVYSVGLQVGIFRLKRLLEW